MSSRKTKTPKTTKKQVDEHNKIVDVTDVTNVTNDTKIIDASDIKEVGETIEVGERDKTTNISNETTTNVIANETNNPDIIFNRRRPFNLANALQIPQSESEIASVEFYIIGSDEIKKNSHISVTSKDLFRNGVPFPDGLYDAHMGTTDPAWNCQTCCNRKELCPGHFGHLVLNYPVINPLCIKDVIRWLKVICFRCGNLIIEKDIKCPKSKKLAEYAKIAHGLKNSICHVCTAWHPHINKDKQDPTKILLEKYDAKVLVHQGTMYNHQISLVFNKVSDETVLKLGKPLMSHPRNFVMGIIPIPPNTVRPDIKISGGIRSNNNDITTAAKKIVEINETLPIVIPDVVPFELDRKYTNLNLLYHEMINGSTTGSSKLKVVPEIGKQLASLKSRLPRKPGRIRQNLMGKRVEYMMRSVITCDNSLKINEVGVPIQIARNIQIPVTVQEYNRDLLLLYFLNGTKNYPGCTKIWKKSTNHWHSINIIQDDFQLEIGDVIMRDLITGDYMNFNRQPSLRFASISSHRIVVLDEGSTLRMNVSACNLYNADFDGDQMNGLVPRSTQAINESSQLAAVSRWFISYQDSNPMIGCFQDGLIGIAELSRNDVMIDRYHVMQLLGSLIDSFIGKDFISQITTNKTMTSKELISACLPKINFKRNSSFFKDEYTKFIKYDTAEITVKIERGKMVSGVLDKSSVGQGVGGNMLQLIHNEYGARFVLELTHNLQQLATNYLFANGYTISIKDLVLNPKDLEGIHQIASSIIDEANMITEKLNAGNIIPPIGMTTYEFYEALSMNALNSGDAFMEFILRSINPRENNMFKLIMHGSKGKPNNFYSISSSIGQVNIDGERISQLFGYKRTLPYFTRFDTSAPSRGYIGNSFMSGVNITEFFLASMEARVTIIRKALSTSVTGEQNRKSIKNLENIVVDNCYKSVKARAIIQLLYGEDGLDPRRIEIVSFSQLFLSDTEFEKMYLANRGMFAPVFSNKELDKKLQEEYGALLKARKYYRDTFMKIIIQRDNMLMPDKMHMPVNVKRIMDDVIYATGAIDLAKVTANDTNNKSKSTKSTKSTNGSKGVKSMSVDSNNTILDPFVAIDKVDKFLASLPYVLINEIQERLQSRIPIHIEKAFELFKVLVRINLSTTQLVINKITIPMLDTILNKIKSTYMKALIDYGCAVGIIAAQSLSEPLTQFVLDSHHRAGGAGGAKKTSGIKRIKEIMGAQPTKSMANPVMFIMVKEQYRENENKVREIANHIEMLPFERFVKRWHIFFENYKEPIHPDFKDEVQMIKNFERHNPGIKIPKNLIKWCIRYELDKPSLILKNMKLETIINKLEDVINEAFIVYTPENADRVIVRIYLMNTAAKKNTTMNIDQMENIHKKIMNLTIRGVEGIYTTSVITAVKSKIQPDGSINNLNKIFAISTNGTNIMKIIENEFIDPELVQTDSIEEIYNIYGIEAARQKIINELKVELKDTCSHRHFTIYADEMTQTGVVTSIERAGLKKRDASGILLRMSTGSPMEVLQEGAINNITDIVDGMSAPLMVGKSPNVGSTYNKFHINEEFVKRNRINAQSILQSIT